MILAWILQYMLYFLCNALPEHAEMSLTVFQSFVVRAFVYLVVYPKDRRVRNRAVRVSNILLTIYGIGWGGGIPRENMAQKLFKIELET